MKWIVNIAAACFITIALNAQAATSVQKAAAEIDALLEVHWQSQGVKGNAPISDEVFVRRVYLDLAGRIPTSAEALCFLQSTKTDRRAALIDALLNQESYVSNFYNFWADVLRYKSQYVNRAGVIEAAYGKFIRDSLRSNKPYDQFVREMLSAKGFAWDNGAIGYYHRDPEMPLDNMALTARIFLGTRMECAQCHDHPFDKWKQTEFYRLAAYTYGNKSINEPFESFRNASRAREQSIRADFEREKAASSDSGRAAEQHKNERLNEMDIRKLINVVRSCVGHLFSPVGLNRNVESKLKLPHDFKEADGKPFDVMKPAALMGAAAEVASDQDPAEVLARWTTSPTNSRFTMVIVNRLWKRMFGVALIEPLDQIRDETTAMVPALEEYLEKLMVEQRYDMRAFLAVIANTKSYQAAVAHEEYSRDRKYDFQGPLLRRMTAEQMWDSMIALASYEPDARDLSREQREERRINVSKMAFEAYLNFDGEKLLEMARAGAKTESELEGRETILREAVVAAKGNGDKAKSAELNKQLDVISRERGEFLVRDFILPILTNLAQKKAGKDAVPIVDNNYAMNGNPRVLPTETWRKIYVSGYGPAPKNTEQLAADAATTKQRMLDLATRLGIPENVRPSFLAYCNKSNGEWFRASELESPAPRGHFLRTMGQSDRDFVENASHSASIPQALLLMNNEILSERGFLSLYSPLMMSIKQSETPAAKLDAAYLAVLSRKPTTEEKAIWNKAASTSASAVEDLLYALLNSKQFIFIQ